MEAYGPKLSKSQREFVLSSLPLERFDHFDDLCFKKCLKVHERVGSETEDNCFGRIVSFSHLQPEGACPREELGQTWTCRKITMDKSNYTKNLLRQAKQNNTGY